ncbi:MAG: hypothetical protein ACJ768_02350 [Gaiellaceae bacterium]
MDGGVTYRGLYLRRGSAENAFRTCHRRGWEPLLRRVLGVWVVSVSVEPLQHVATLTPQPSGRLAAGSHR